MRKSTACTAATTIIAAVAGTATAQPIIDGKIDEGGVYPPLIYVNTQNPTGFGDNTPANVPPSGDAATATSGVELVIPLSAIGDPTGDFAISAYVASGDANFLSNQVVGGLPNLGNLGPPPIDFGAIDMDQFITVSPETAGPAPVLDGDKDDSYGDPQDGWLQNNFTGFGDATHGNIDGGSGSEVDAVFAWSDADNLHLLLTGNLEANANTLFLYFDTVSGGQSTLQDNNPSFDNPINPDFSDVLDAQADTSFDDTFEPDFAVVLAGTNVGDDPPDFQIGGHYATLPTAGGGEDFFLGTAMYADATPPTGADQGAPAIGFTIDNSNTEGVTGSPPVDIPSRDDAVGSEIDGFTAFIDPPTNRLYFVITGNLQTNFNKLDVFLDVDGETTNEGQNTIRNDNVDIDFGAFQNMADDPNTPEPEQGLTFEEGMNVDYWIGFGNGNVPVEVFANAAVLRTNGPLTLQGARVDYGAFDGGLKSENDPVPFDGPRIDGQDGFTDNIFTNYGPRKSTESLIEFLQGGGTPGDPPPAPETNLIEISIDNSNIEGVTDTDPGNADEVTTGIEYAVDLDELGWDGESPIKVVAMIQSGGHDFMSNQVVGGLPADSPNLGSTAAVDFSTIDGQQFALVPAPGEQCPPDLTGPGGDGVPDGSLTADDFFFYLGLFSAGDPQADLTGPGGDGVPDGNLTADDFFFYLGLFAAGCP